MVYKSVFTDTENKKRVLKLINNIIDKNENFIIFGLLLTLPTINSIDKELFSNLLVKIITNDNTGQIAIYLLEKYHYLYINNLISKEELIKCIKKCINFIKSFREKEDFSYEQSLGNYLFYYYLNEKDKVFEDLLNDATKYSNQVNNGILNQIFEQELHSKNEEKIKISKQFILKFKDIEDNSYFFDFTKMNGLNFIQEDFDFIKKLAQSINVKKEIRSFIEYLQNEYHLDTTISEKILEILENIILNVNSIKDLDYYNSQPLIEFILELNNRIKSEQQKNNILNLIDKFLLNDVLRHSTKSSIG